MKGWNSYNGNNQMKRANTFNSSRQFEPSQNHVPIINDFDYLRGNIPVIITRIGNHYYHHQYIYVPIIQNDIYHDLNEFDSIRR